MTLEAIKAAIAELPETERASLASWLVRLDSEAWDRQIDADFSEGGAGTPQLDRNRDCWRVPVVLSYTQLGVVGSVGEIVVDAASGQVMEHTPIAAMQEVAKQLYEQHKDAIEAPLF